MMFAFETGDFQAVWTSLCQTLPYAPEVFVGEVQSVALPRLDSFVTHELTNVVLKWPLPQSVSSLQNHISPNLPWAEEQFQERISGQPLNPPPSHEHWPHAEAANDRHLRSGRFDHTYPERFWPKRAGSMPGRVHPHSEDGNPRQLQGIRFSYGDLNDVVTMLCKNEMTRQAYLPIFFPEDTGATEGQRVPCTLGYHFLYRGGQLNITYFIRSVDFWKHFKDDVYMAGRLCQWMVEQISEADPELQICAGHLTMHIVSLHLFKADVPKVKGAI